MFGFNHSALHHRRAHQELLMEQSSSSDSSPIMNPSPAKRPRRTSSPEPDTPVSQGPLRRPSPSLTLPPIQSGAPPPSYGGPSTWSSAWRGASRPSQGAEGSQSPKMEEDDPEPSGTTGGPSSAAPGSSSSVVFTRDVNPRAPRSMMACVRCRRQKYVPLFWMILLIQAYTSIVE